MSNTNSDIIKFVFEVYGSAIGTGLAVGAVLGFKRFRKAKRNNQEKRLVTGPVDAVKLLASTVLYGAAGAAGVAAFPVALPLALYAERDNLRKLNEA